MEKRKIKKAHNAYASALRLKLYQPKVVKDKKKEANKKACRYDFKA